MKDIFLYRTADDKCPFEKWMSKLDNSVRIKIINRLDRIAEGNYGDCKKLNSEISELRFAVRSGYRIYFSEFQNVLIILLCGGNKATQSKDIENAKKYLKEFKERYKDEN